MLIDIQITAPKGSKCLCGRPAFVYVEAFYMKDEIPAISHDRCQKCLGEEVADLPNDFE